MDRFIGKIIITNIYTSNNLKSNMDRFIVLHLNSKVVLKNNLKSNMDRFIVYALSSASNSLYLFKIQYG